MPYDQQHELGRAIQYTRSDHSIAIPRPALDRSLGLTGACQGCHANSSSAALDAQVTAWWGTLKPQEPAVAGILAARTIASLEAATPQLLHPDSRHAMAQVAGLAGWLDRFTRSSATAPSSEAEARLRRLATADALDVRAVALAALHLSAGGTRSTRAFLQEQLEPTAADSKVALRRRWAVVLGGIGDEARTAGRSDQAIAAYRAALEVAPGDGPLLVNLGLARAAKGDFAGAVDAYQQALRADPAQPLTAVNLGIALEQSGDLPGAEAAWRRAIAIDPTNALGYLNLGTQRLRSERAADARPYIEQALARDPGLATGHFQLALVRLQAGDLAGAEQAVRRSLALDSTNAEAVKLSEALREARNPR